MPLFERQVRAERILIVLVTCIVYRFQVFFPDLLVPPNDDFSVGIFQVFQGNPTEDSRAELFDDLAALYERGDFDAIEGAAVRLPDNYVVGDVDQSPRQITGVCRLQCRVGKTLSRAAAWR